MKVGYARVSTTDQSLSLQTDALKQAGCEKLYHDQISGASANRPGLADALTYVREGDVLVVWRLDRLGRSLPHLIEVVTKLAERGEGSRVCRKRLTQRPTADGSSFTSLGHWPSLSAG
jgi:DNA invertase Pin-like site-specific DNA recombinase